MAGLVRGRRRDLGAARAVADHLEMKLIPDDVLTHNVMLMAIDIDLNTRDRLKIREAAESVVKAALTQIWS